MTPEQKALNVIAQTPHIKNYLREHDPNAWKQVIAAIGRNHIHVRSGFCDICWHYGEDCTRRLEG